MVEGRRRFLAVGGDGSVNDVLNGIMTIPRPADDLVTLAPIPLGTGNDWARSLGMPRDPAGIAATIAAEDTFLHDVGLLEFAPDASGRAARHWFINIAGAGFDSYVIARLPAQIPTRFAYLRGALGGLVRYRAARFRIVADSGAVEERLLLAFVANGQYCGNGMHVAPQARLDDGRFEVIAIRGVGLLKALSKLGKLYRGELRGDPLLWEAHGARVRIETDTSEAVQADGQVVGQTPVEMSVRPVALRALRAFRDKT